MWWKGKAGPCFKAISFIALLFGEAAADLTLVASGREPIMLPSSISYNSDAIKLQEAYPAGQAGAPLPQLIIVENLPESYNSNEAEKQQIVFLDDAFDKRAPIMSSKALGLVILGSTILASTAAIRHMTHMHILPPSIRKTFGIEDGPVKPGVYKITQEELQALEALEEKARGDGEKQLSKRNLSEDDNKVEQSSVDHPVEKRAMFPESGMSGASVAKYAALAGLGGYLLRAWQHPPAPPQYYRKRDIDEKSVEARLEKRSPTIYSYPKAAGLIGLAGFAGWLSQVYGHEAKDQYPNGRREVGSVDLQGDDILVRRSNDDLVSRNSSYVRWNRRADEPSDASLEENATIIDGDYKINDQSNAASTRLKQPSTLFWQILFVSMATILFLTSSTNAAISEDDEQVVFSDESSTEGCDQLDSDPVKRSDRLISSPHSPYVPLAPPTFHEALNGLPILSTPDAGMSNYDQLQHSPPWDGKITRKDHEEAHQRWISSQFHDNLDNLEKLSIHAESTKNAHYGTSSKAKTKLARKLKADERYHRELYQQSPASAPSPDHVGDNASGSDHDLSKYPDQFNLPHTLEREPNVVVEAAPSPSSQSMTESDRHKFKLDMGSFGVGIASTIGAEVAYLGALGIAKSARKARSKSLVPVEKSQSPVESVHRQQDPKEDEIPLSEGMPSSSQPSPLSQRMPGPSFKETRRRLSLNKRSADIDDIESESERGDDLELRKRSGDGNLPTYWSSHQASASGSSSYNPPFGQYAEAPSWIDRPFNLQHLTDREYQYIVNKEAGGYESEESHDETPPYEQGGQAEYQPQSKYYQQGRRVLRQSAEGPTAPESAHDAHWPSFEDDCIQGAKISAGAIGGGAAVYGATVASISCAKKLRRDRNKHMEGLRIRPLAVEPEDYIVPPVQDIHFDIAPQEQEYYPERRAGDTEESLLVKRSIPPSNTPIDSIAQSGVDWPSMNSLSQSLPYASPSAISNEAQSWRSRPYNLQDMPAERYNQLIEEEFDEEYDTEGYETPQSSTSHDVAHNGRSKNRGRKLLSKSASSPTSSVFVDAEASAPAPAPASSYSDQTDPYTMGDLAQIALQTGITFGLATGAAGAMLEKGVKECRKSIRRRQRDAARRIRVVPGAADIQHQEVQNEQDEGHPHPIRRSVPTTKEAPRHIKRSLTPSVPPAYTSSSVSHPIYNHDQALFSSVYNDNETSLRYGLDHEFLEDVPPSILAAPSEQIEKLKTTNADESIPAIDASSNRKSRPRRGKARKLLQMDIVEDPDGGLGAAAGTTAATIEEYDHSFPTTTEQAVILGVMSGVGTAGISTAGYMCHQARKEMKEKRKKMLQVRPEVEEQVEGADQGGAAELQMQQMEEEQPIEQHLVKRDASRHLYKRSTPVMPDYSIQDQVISSRAEIPYFDPNGLGDWRHSSYSGHYSDRPEYLNRPLNLQESPAEDYYNMIEDLQASELDDDGVDERKKAKSKAKRKSIRRMAAEQANRIAAGKDEHSDAATDGGHSDPADVTTAQKGLSSSAKGETGAHSSSKDGMPKWEKAVIGCSMIGGMGLIAATCNCLAYGTPLCCCCRPPDVNHRKREVADREGGTSLIDSIVVHEKGDCNEGAPRLQKRSFLSPAASPYGSPDQVIPGGSHVPHFDLDGTGNWRHNTYSGHPDDRPEYLDRPVNMQGVPAQGYYQMLEEMQAANLNDEASSSSGTRQDKSKLKSSSKSKSKPKSSKKEQRHRRLKQDQASHYEGDERYASGGIAPGGHEHHQYAVAPAPSPQGERSAHGHRNNLKMLGVGAGVAIGMIGTGFACSHCLAGDCCYCCECCPPYQAKPQKRDLSNAEHKVGNVERKEKSEMEKSHLQKRSSITPVTSPCGSPGHLSQSGGHVPAFDLTGSGDWRHSTYSGHPDDRPEYLDRPVNLQGLPAEEYYRMIDELQTTSLDEVEGQERKVIASKKSKLKSKEERSKLKQKSLRRMAIAEVSKKGGGGGGGGGHGGGGGGGHGGGGGRAGGSSSSRGGSGSSEEASRGGRYFPGVYSHPADSSDGSEHATKKDWAIAGGVVGGVALTVMGCSCYLTGNPCCCDPTSMRKRSIMDSSETTPLLSGRLSHIRKEKKRLKEKSHLQKRSNVPLPYVNPDQASPGGAHIPYFDQTGSGDWRHASYSGHLDDRPEYLDRPINLQGVPAEDYYKLIDGMQSTNLKEGGEMNLDEVAQRKGRKGTGPKAIKERKSGRRKTLNEMNKFAVGGGGHGGGGGGHGGEAASAGGHGGEAEGSHGATYIPHASAGGSSSGNGSSSSSNKVFSGKNIGIGAAITGAIAAGTMACSYCATGDPFCICGGCDCLSNPNCKRSLPEEEDKVSLTADHKEDEKRREADDLHLQKRSLTPSPYGSPDQISQGGAAHVPHFDLTGTGDWRHNSYTGHADDVPQWTHRASNLQHLDSDFYHKLTLGSEEEANRLYEGESHPIYHQEYAPDYAPAATPPSSSKSKSKGKSKKSGRSLRAGTAGGAAVYGGAAFNGYGSTSAEAPQEGQFGKIGSNPHTGAIVGGTVGGIAALGGVILGCKWACGKCMDCREARANAKEEARREEMNVIRAQHAQRHFKRCLPEEMSSEEANGATYLHKRSSTPPAGYTGSSSPLHGAESPYYTSSSTSWGHIDGHSDDVPEYLRRPINMQGLPAQQYAELLDETQQYNDNRQEASFHQEIIAPSSSSHRSSTKSSSRRALREKQSHLAQVEKAGGGGGGGRAGGGGGGGNAAAAAGEEGEGESVPFVYGGGFYAGAQGPSDPAKDHRDDIRNIEWAAGSVAATLAIGGGCIAGERIRNRRRQKKKQLQEEQERLAEIQQTLQQIDLQGHYREANEPVQGDNVEMAMRHNGNFNHFKRDLNSSFVSDSDAQKQIYHPRHDLFNDDEDQLDKRATLGRGARKAMENGIVLGTSLAAAAGGYAAVNAVFDSPDVVVDTAK